MAEVKPYALSDLVIKKLHKSMLRRAEQTKRKLLLAGFDELNVIQQIDALYDALDADNRKKYTELFIAKYLLVNLRRKFTVDEIAELLEMRLAWREIDDAERIEKTATLRIDKLLSEPNPVTHYIYDLEAIRKRDRAKESINASTGKVQKQNELDKSIRFWGQMTDWYSDLVEDDANIQSMKDSGVTEVIWHTQEDDRVCRECQARDGKIYNINRVPPKPHVACRCWVSPVKTARK